MIPKPTYEELEQKIKELEKAAAQRKQIEEALRETERRLSRIAENCCSVPTFIIDENLVITHWNRACENITGTLASEVIGTKDQWKAFYAEKRPVMADLIVKGASEEEMDRFYGDRCHKSVLIEGAFEAEGFFPDMGESGRWLFFTANPLKDHHGKIIGAIETLQKITDRNLMEESLKTTNKQFKEIIEFLPDATLIVDRDKKVIAWNHAMEEMTGVPKKDIIGKDHSCCSVPFYGKPVPYVIDLLDADDNDVASRYDFIKRKGGVLYAEVFTPALYNNAGAYVWAVASPLLDDDGNMIGAIESIRDITEHKRAEEKLRGSLHEKEVLLREIHHRVKNNMQIISSLLNLQSQYVKDKEALEMFKKSRDRIFSMASIHEKLYYSGDLARIDFAGYIKGLARYLLRTYSVKESSVNLIINCSDVYLGIDKAVPCGLIINELISNALKHAFPEGSEGELTVYFQPDGDENMILAVSDNGRGFPEDIYIRNARTLGLHLVSTLVDQLKGTLEIERGSGTTLRITFAP